MDAGAFQTMPKADLHVHIDGSVRPATIVDLAREGGVNLPTTDPVALAEAVSVGPECSSLSDFLKTFDVFYPLLKSPGALERIAFEMVEDAADDGVSYLEARFAPVLQSSAEFPIAEAVGAALRGFHAGLSSRGIDGGLLLCCYRSESPASSEETVEAALRFREEGVVGLDLAGDELNHPGLPHLPPFVRARKAELPVTVHAGEVGPVANIQEALFLFGARRLGHGVRLVEDPELLAYVAGEWIPVETCLTSNVQTGAVPSLEAHPLRALIEAGVHTTLNTDDPAVCRTSLSREYALAAKAFGLSLAELRRIAENGFAAAFRQESGREAMELERWFDEHVG
ncbi:MAG: adenosine deaminase [Planctomycetota bacterium]|jgi:adenosine deaminase